jgi:type III pantothenate kinase
LNLVIDIGNTRVKAALFKDNHLFELKIYESVSALLTDFNFIRQAKNAIIGSVVDELELFYSALSSILPTLMFNSQTKTPLVNLYHSAATLGSDRLAASVGAYGLYPNSTVLVIDAGTCIKYNFTNSKNEYLGGAISPGIGMKFKSLEHFTSKLPLIEFDKSYNQLIGTNTKNSILSGVLNGSVAEIDGLISDYKSNFPDLICILTGGDSEFLAKRLKNSIFTHQNLVLKGLNDILNYNLEKK